MALIGYSRGDHVHRERRDGRLSLSDGGLSQHLRRILFIDHDPGHGLRKRERDLVIQSQFFRRVSNRERP